MLVGWYGVWPPLPRRVNNGRANAAGVVEWNPKQNPKYAFTSPEMEVAINRTRWSAVLDLLGEMVIAGALSTNNATIS